MKMFRSTTERYAQNVEDGQNVIAAAAVLTPGLGLAEHGVAIFAGQHPRLVIPSADAVRLATQIADIVTAQRNGRNP